MRLDLTNLDSTYGASYIAGHYSLPIIDGDLGASGI
jgi:hypothetical protein